MTIKKLQKILKEHSIKNWKVKIAPYFERVKDGAILVGGYTAFDHKTIFLTEDILEKNADEIITKLFLHEVAHVIVGKKAKHNYQFRKVAKQIGGYPNHTLAKEVQVVTKQELLEKQEEVLGSQIWNLLVGKNR